MAIEMLVWIRFNKKESNLNGLFCLDYRTRRSSMAEKETATRFDDEQIIEIEIERLRSFKDHPFKVEDD